VCSKEVQDSSMASGLRSGEAIFLASFVQRAVFPCHRTQRRAKRRVSRMVVRATHTPLMRVLPGPQPTATWVIMSSGSGTEIGAGVRACADAVTDKGKIVTAINRIISASLGVLLR